MDQRLDVSEFLNECAAGRVLLDVRSPGEYHHGHIPGALCFPLFSDEERARVGTCYKQRSAEEAMEMGLDIVGPKMGEFVRIARRLAPDRRLAIHCWRGGQRSGSMAWLMRQAGFDVVTLKGGYKQYRQFVLNSFQENQLQLRIIGGRTGSGKTQVLHQLALLGEQIVDLEALAHHKGSAFGSIGEPEQPTVEQFENDLYHVLRALDPARRVWLENESRSIGRVYIPPAFWHYMRQSPLFNIQIPEQARIDNLLRDYVRTDKSELESAFRRIDKKLGGQHLKAALEALDANDFATAARIALHYYDKTYQHGLESYASEQIQMLEYDHGEPEGIARDLVTRCNTDYAENTDFH